VIDKQIRMKSLKEKLSSSPPLRRLYGPFRPLFSKHSRHAKYWEMFKHLPERDLTVDTVHGRLTFSSRDKFIGRSLYTAGYYGYSELVTAINILKANHKLADANQGYVVDIGANIGTVCIPLVADGTFGKAIAFEPEPRNFNYLTRNVKQNGVFDRISVYQLALSSTNGELELEVAVDNYGDHRIRTTAPSAAFNSLNELDRKVIRVPVQSLDFTIQSLGIDPKEIKLVWMDVQGHEGHILQGAQSLIATGVPVVFELWPYGLRSAGTDLEWFIEFVTSRFTRLWDLNADDPQELPIASIRQMFDRLKSNDATAQTNVLVF
jgi:FkbM family methyltransferase